MTTTIERNYRTNPHTANFLMTFHSAAYGLPTETTPDQDDARADRGDLLDLVPADAVADLRSPAQRDLIEKLIHEVTELDAETGAQARTYTDGMTDHGMWTPGREGNVSRWIGNLITKANALKAAARRTAPAASPVTDGRYAVEHEGTLKFYKVKNGRNAGFVFLDVQASDDWHPIRNLTKIREILALIAVDAKAAMIRYGQEIGECGHCGRTLTDAASRAAGIGPVCAGK
jgi:hypothetical protein